MRGLQIMKKIFFGIGSGLLMMLFCLTNVFAGEISILVDELVKRDILSPVEAQIILDETKQQVAKEIAEQKSYAVPSWVQKVKLKGDLRLRYQSEEKDSTKSGKVSTSKRERGRVRIRVGAEAKVTEGCKLNFGLASGGSDPRSTNQTFQDNFSTKGINLDYAYANFSPMQGLNILGGKIKGKKTIWMNSDLLWDGDVNPEGIALKATVPGTDFFVNTAYFVLDEIKKYADPTMVVVQPGLKMEIMDGLILKSALNYYAFNSIQGLDYSNIYEGGETNTLTSDSHLKYDYDAWGFSTEWAMKDVVPGMINYTAVFTDYISNLDPSDQNTGYLVGFKFGDKKVAKPGTWQTKALYRELEKDAWPDFLADSDLLGGITDAKGYELIFKYALAKNVVLGFDFYNTETIKAVNKKEQTLFQADCVFKF